MNGRDTYLLVDTADAINVPNAGDAEKATRSLRISEEPTYSSSSLMRATTRGRDTSSSRRDCTRKTCRRSAPASRPARRAVRQVPFHQR